MADPRNFSEEAFDLQKQRHDVRILQVKITFIIASGLLFVAIIVICGGLVIVIVRNLSGIIFTAIGTFLGVLSGILFKYNSDANKRLDRTGQEIDLRASFNDANRDSERIINTIPDTKERSKALAKLAKDIRKPPPQIILHAAIPPQTQRSPGFISTLFRRFFQPD